MGGNVLLELVRGQVVQATAEECGIVLAVPNFDADRRLLARANPLQRQAPVAEFSVEAIVSPALCKRPPNPPCPLGADVRA